MSSDYRPLAEPHLVWVYAESLTEKLDVATWLETSQEMCKMGWRVTLVAAGSAAPQFVDSVRVVYIAKPHVYLLRQVAFHLGLLRYLVREWADTDIVLFHQMAAPWVLSLRLLRRLAGRKRPLLVMDTRDLTVPGNDLKSHLRALYQELVRRLANRWADGQTAITQRMADLQFIPAKQLWGIWPSGVNLDRFVQAQAAAGGPRLRNQSGWSTLV